MTVLDRYHCMPTVTFRGQEIECKEGETLRNVLKRAGLTPHNGKSKTFNCQGFASCGTCAVAVDGEVNEKGLREKGRLIVPPHHPNYNLRLSCQTKVLGDVRVEKYPGMWGTQIAEGPLGPLEEPTDKESTDKESTDKEPTDKEPQSDEPTAD